MTKLLKTRDNQLESLDKVDENSVRAGENCEYLELKVSNEQAKLTREV